MIACIISKDTFLLLLLTPAVCVFLLFAKKPEPFLVLNSPEFKGLNEFSVVYLCKCVRIEDKVEESRFS